MAFDWKKVVRGIVPTLAGALVPGSPVVKSAMQAIGAALLGKPDAQESEIAEALKAGASIEQVAALKKAETDFEEKLAQFGVDLAKLEVEDRISARERQIAMHDVAPAVLAVVVHGLLAYLLWAMFTRAIPTENKSAADILVGVLGGGVASVWSFYFGSSMGSRLKDAAAARVPEK